MPFSKSNPLSQCVFISIDLAALKYLDLLAVLLLGGKTDQCLQILAFGAEICSGTLLCHHLLWIGLFQVE